MDIDKKSRSLSKLYPGYTVQNEMTASGLRGELGLPSVYFYLAVFDALGDIKCQWTRTKLKVLKLLGENENLTGDEKHYLRFLLKVSNAFAAVLTQELVKLPKEIQEKQEELSKLVDTGKLHRYLCRQVRKYHVRLHTDKAQGFSLSQKAYRYKDHGIYLATKERRKRIFIELTDGNQYAMRRVLPLTGENVAVCGLGTIGLLLVSFLLDAGVKNIFVIGNKVFQKEIVLDMGLSEQNFCDSRRVEVDRWMMERTGGAGADDFF